MTNRDEVIEELLTLVLMQDEEIKKLKRRMQRIKQYIEVYEDYIKRDDF